MHCDSIQEFAPSLQPSSSNLIRKSPFHLETSNVKSKCFMTFISVSWGHSRKVTPDFTVRQKQKFLVIVLLKILKQNKLRVNLFDTLKKND